ncbi:DHH family phosphoesterase [Hyperthermus butylicus]|uniref:Phosphohydrolase, DHH superfamily n=1 Tax=Hyperthermus butylicus (strain DSM 5456 / JCM 9403 / PLM1-5) TaxID=415426 RepID=A2BK01_HYPBU|nr:putative phosphohydrolase, DHH superfamily [Hyperthermus butylicus DSM 5456]
MKVHIVTHTDLDGVASAAIYLRLSGLKLGVDASLTFTEPHKLHKTLQSIESVNRIVIMDLGPNTSTIEKIADTLAGFTSKGVAVEWYDHHRWQEEWIARLRELGVRVHIDTTTCAAGVVARYAPKELGIDVDDYAEKLAAITCAADLWRWDEPMATRLYRVVDRYRGARGDQWRRRLVEGFVSGSLWWPELDGALSDYLRLEFSGFNYALRNTVVRDINGCRVVAVLKRPGPPSASILGNILLSRFSADIAVIVRARGSKGISFRSSRINVREIAIRLGGGGHPKAAGAPLSLSLPERLIALFYPKVKLKAVMRSVEAVLRELGGCEKLRL